LQGFPGKQIGSGSPSKAFVPLNVFSPFAQGIPGAQTGMGLPENPDATANAIPNNRTTNPSMILAFT